MSIVTLEELLAHFPLENPRKTQVDALRFAASRGLNVVEEIPTGVGKTAIGMTILRTLASQGVGPLFYVVPSKALVDQIHSQYPDVTVVLGRSEYDCLYYTERGERVNARDSPCYMLKCKHRVDPETGETEEAGATPCPYLLAKREAGNQTTSGKIVVTTMAFFLINRFVDQRWRELEPALVVLDECHSMPGVARSLFEYRMTVRHLWRVGDILTEVAPDQAEAVYETARMIKRITESARGKAPTLLKPEEIKQLVRTIESIDVSGVERNLHTAIDGGDMDPFTQRGDIKIVEDIIRSAPKFLRSLHYALADEESDRNPLNYVVAFRYEDDDVDDGSTRATAWVGIRSYFVASLIRRASGKRVTAYSATIGDNEIFGHESGLNLPFKSFPYSFSADRARIYLPTDTPNLSRRKARNGDPRQAEKMITEAVARFKQSDKRSLVVVVSEEERARLERRMTRAGLNVVTYGGDVKAKQAAATFKAGEGDVLLGTEAQYAQGIDLPSGIAPVIFYLRPGYQRPDDPMTQFEQRRFSSGHCWRLWQYRVMLKALQVRGRNIRSGEDVGVCFFVSQQFRRIVFNTLPAPLRDSYSDRLTLEACIDDALGLLTA